MAAAVAVTAAAVMAVAEAIDDSLQLQRGL
jgi:hypothetical protein